MNKTAKDGHVRKQMDDGPNEGFAKKHSNPNFIQALQA